MFHRHKHRSIMGMDMDVDMDVRKVAKVVAAGALMYGTIKLVKGMFRD